MRKPRALPKTRSADIDKLRARREQLIRDRKSTAVVERELNLAVAAQIRKEVREEMAS